ncbi:hypothetical protein IWQ57_000562 [Coemansia nantahalensis]|uniref:Uncharacterized protein n=1 Tax=Coemansia nantahalensis TaxID=2789366 RepID=A0ACC1K7J3_9FUNG|nr:hypothetical protein IWQ57_000562 [Coemansia nantahalensis]
MAAPQADRAGGGGAPACSDCGGTALLWSGGDEYCSECGAVLDSVLLTADSEHVPEGEEHRNYVPHLRRANKSDPGDVRFHKTWNRGMTAEAHRSIGALCAALGMAGLGERSQRIFDDSVRALMGGGARVVFGRWTAARVCACVYVAAREAGRVLGLVDIAREARVGVFLVGREVKRAAAALGMQLPQPDPLLQAETAVNRLVGLATTARRDPALEAEVVAAVAAAARAAQKQLPAQLLAFLAGDPQLRPALVEATGALMEFDRACSRHTGVNPNTLVCAALALAVEHAYAASEHSDGRALKQGHRDVVIRLVALRNGAGHSTVAQHMAAMQKALVQASSAVPWLAGMSITRNSVAAHALDIAFCYGQAQSWVFSVRASPDADAPAAGNAVSALPGLLAALDKAPSFARAETRREHRARILDADAPPPAAGDREAAVVGRLCALGVARDALLALPLATLEQMLPAAARAHALTDAARSRLDLPTVTAADMSDGEVDAYLRRP